MNFVLTFYKKIKGFDTLMGIIKMMILNERKKGKNHGYNNLEFRESLW